MNTETTLYDSKGNPTAYFDAEGTLYTWDGRSHAYLDDEVVYGWKGRHLGWFVGEVMYDTKGYPVAFTKQTCPSSPRGAGAKYLKFVKYAKYVKYVAYGRPMLHTRPSGQDLTEFITQDSCYHT